MSPSTLFAVASILEGCAFLNGSPQNTLVPGALELAERYRVFVGGDDFKSGQTKVKSVLVDFLIGSGLKVCESGRVQDGARTPGPTRALQTMTAPSP